MRKDEALSKKIDLNITILIAYFMILAITFSYFELGENLENYFMVSLLMIVALISYYINNTVALIMSMVIDFLYCTYHFYLSFSTGKDLPQYVYYWIVFIPLTAIIISKLGHLIITIQDENLEMLKQTEELVMVDEATGIRNQKAFINELPIYMNLHKRYDMPITLVLVRLKHSKTLSRIVGKEFFSDVLAKCSEALSDSLRFEDRKYIVNENTFAYILISNKDGANIVKNRMKEAIKEVKLGKDKLYSDLNIEVEIGSYSQNEEVTDSLQFINLAEKELDYDV